MKLSPLYVKIGASAMTMGRTMASCPAVFAVFIVCIGLLYPSSATNVSIIELLGNGEVGGSVNISCEVYPETAIVSLTFKNQTVRGVTHNSTIKITRDQDGNVNHTKITFVTIANNATKSDAGLYTCEASLDDVNNTTDKKSVNLDLFFNTTWINGSDTITVFLPTPTSKIIVEAWCVFEAYDAQTVNWFHRGSNLGNEEEKDIQQISPRMIKSTHNISIHSIEDHGTYICEIGNERGQVNVTVKTNPTLSNFTAFGISTSEIYLQWNISLNNVDFSTLLYKVNITENGGKYSYQTPIPSNNTSYVIQNLTKSTNYLLELLVTAENFTWHQYPINVTTLNFDPEFTPNISINGFSATSVTIGLQKLPQNIAQYIHYYILEAYQKDKNESRTAFHSINDKNLPYMFDNLKPHSTYIFKARACSEYTGECGISSSEMEAATSDGTPSIPTDINLTCSTTFANLTWGLPEKPNAEIKGYTMELTGNATYKDRYGNRKLMTWGPLSKFTTNETYFVVFNDLQPNTDYYVKMSAMTRTRRRGKEGGDSCKTNPAPPDHPPRPRWKKILQGDKYMFKMYLPRLSERNGQLCCYRVYMVRLLPKSDWSNLPEAKNIRVIEYKEAHGTPPKLGAYITDIFSNGDFPSDSELIMGDNQSHFNKTGFNSACSQCLRRPRRFEPMTTTTTTTQPTTTDDYVFATDDSVVDEPKKTKRNSNTDFKNDLTMRDSTADHYVSDRESVEAYDGPLDGSANYTLFVEVISMIKDEPPMYSDYVNILMPAATPPMPQPTSAIEIALQATCAVAALVLLLMIVFCIRQTRRSRKMPPHAPLEMNSLQAAIRNMFGGRPRHHMPSAPPTMDPIPKDELATAYAERQVNSDYGFQQEFEMLPEYYPDRTTHASEARENQPKNRYPDIKAYDQTRVKLTPIDGVPGSDYINANYVMGYQDRKQFICAQGPTDTTVNDFWRMIWEQGLELVVMLTNLEECAKVKCSQYWPEARGERAFGPFTVQHVSEKRYSDYIVRELRISKPPVNSDGLPIVEGNGIAKRNGDCKDPSDDSVPTSPREVKLPETRTVKQYHFLMWKDFAAPEHAYSILKFIKRVNEAWSGMLGRACVVHCSAGVGRTGTLAALDCLLAQLAAEGHAAVFNTIAELRRSRNFLVQSLKQYVFVYRALVEYAHYDDTEIPAARLKASVDRLRNMPPQATNCLMEIEFEKILSCPIQEPVKSCAAGAAEELRPKNRCVDILPYDRNRVILAPIPGRDYSTYINASFIEAYDNSEGFIITQDPMPSTIMDFWRMVSEHNVTTIVMLSELGEGKCPRYWDDGTAQYEHISVQYDESESCPYYTRRQFSVINNKSGCTSNVLQLQYQGWPTAPGHVPEVTRGLAELADAAAPNQGTMLVHCHLGTERSALFVALCILITQLRAERRVDVCCVARKVRTQRVKTINTFLQYEFLHRAILNYAELHNLLEDS